MKYIISESQYRMLVNEKKISISEIIENEVKNWVHKYGFDACEINKGDCFIFAEKIQNILNSNGFNDAEVLTTDLFYDTATEEAKHDEEIWYNENDYNSIKPYGFKWPENGHHGWIYVNGKHYDAEETNGVINFYDLPIFKRFTN